MQKQMAVTISIVVLLFSAALPATVHADEYQDTIKLFRDAGESAEFFNSSYGYAVFPSIGKGGAGIGGAYGSGRAYAGGKHVGDTRMTQLTIGFQLGGQVYSQMIFFKDKRAFDEFSSGNFEFGGEASAVAITAGVSAAAKSTGSSAGMSGGTSDATTVGKYRKGMAVFTIAKGGLMYEAAIGGQKFGYTRL